MNDFIEQVRTKQLAVPRLVSLAINRHLKDLKKSEKTNYPFCYDANAGLKVVRFISALTIKQERKPLSNVELQPWQVFFICQVFGWRRKDDGTRRFNNVYLSIPKKNGKTAIAGWIAIYLMLAEGNFTWSGTVAATSLYQAKLLLKGIKSLIRQDRNLKALINIRGDYIEHAAMKSTLQARATEIDALDGLNDNLIFIDEFHTQKTNELYTILRNGLGSKLNQLLMTITTAGDHPDYFAREHELYLIKLLEGKEENDSMFALLYQPDSTDDFDMIETWKKLNPNYGVSFSPDEFYSQYKEAKGRPTNWYKFRTKRLNQWNRTYNVWFQEKEVESKFKPLNEEDYYEYPAYCGLDLSKSEDFSGYTITVKVEGKFFTFFRMWIPQETLEDRIKGESISFQAWVDAGHVLTCDGPIINQEEIFEQFKKDCEKFNIRHLAFDPALGGNYFGKRVDQEFPNMIVQSFPQQSSSMWPATKSFEDYWKTDRLTFDANPAAMWNFCNATIINGPKGGQKVHKDPLRPKDRVDMVICSIMSVDRAVIDFEAMQDPTYSPFYFGAVVNDKEDAKTAEVPANH